MQLKDRFMTVLDFFKEHFFMSFCSYLSLTLLVVSILGLHVTSISPLFIFNTGLTLGFLVFFLWFKQLDERSMWRKVIIDFLSSFFLVSLIIISISNLNFLTNLSPTLANNINLILFIGPIFSGFILFYTNRETITEKIQKDQTKESEAEQRRYLGFPKKFPRIKNLFWKYISKMVHKEGLGHIAILISVISLGFFLRIWNLDYLQGSDNFNLLSARNLAENGQFIYDRNYDITYLLAFLFKFFGSSWEVARMPFVIIGTISIYFVYLLGKTINKKIALFSAFLFAISPVAIEKASFVREYSTIMLVGLMFFLTLLSIYKKFNKRPQIFLISYSLALTLLTTTILLYSAATNTGTIKAVIAILLFESLAIIYLHVKQNHPRLLKYYVIISAISILLFLKTIHIFITLFTSSFSVNPYWFKMFFDPTVSSPMQWFSLSSVSWAFVFLIFSVGVLIKFKRDIFSVLYATFIINVLLFSFKFNGWEYEHSRYLYHLFPFYVVIFSASLYYFFLLANLFKYPRITKIVFIFFLISSILIPQNTFHGANHDLTIWGAVTNTEGRQLTAAGNRNYFLAIFSYLDSVGFNNETPVVLEGEDPFFLTWYYNYPVSRSFYNNKYEMGDKVFSVKKYMGIDELKLATDLYNSGYFLTPSNQYLMQNFQFNNSDFTFKKKIEGYEIYTWQSQELNAAEL